MIRFVSTVSLLALLALVLYLPSAYPPEHFVQQLRSEHGLNVAFWGEEHATRSLARMLDFQSTAQQVSPVPTMTEAPAANSADAAVANEMSQVNKRLFNAPYFRSIDTLLALATYRFCALLEWLPVLLVFMLAVLFDGFLVRIVKSKEFLQHNPEVYALHACAAIVTGCGTVLALVLPVTLPPIVLAFAPVVICVFLSGAVRNFHRRG
jgi:Domain of unknown function (DUF4400)